MRSKRRPPRRLITQWSHFRHAAAPHPFLVATNDALRRIKRHPHWRWPQLIGTERYRLARRRGEQFADVVAFALRERLGLPASRRTPTASSAG